MASYTVHIPAEGAPRTLEAADRMVFVKESFSFWAFLFPFIWVLVHRMWLVFLGLLAVVLALQLIVMGLDLRDEAVAAIFICAQFLFGFEANALRRWSLQRKGWTILAVVSGRNLPECEEKVLAWWLGDQPEASAGVRPMTEETAPRSPPAADDEVIGLFPDPEPRSR